MPAVGRSREQQRRRVGAGDQQQQRDAAGDQQQRRFDDAHRLLGDGDDAARPAVDATGRSAAIRARERVDFGGRLRERDAVGAAGRESS